MMAMPSAATPVCPVAVDLFCGAGGLSYGMQKAGITIIGGIDIDPACKHPFEENVKANFYEYDVSDLTSDFVASLFNEGQTRILAGCAPCQPFSTYTRSGKARSLVNGSLRNLFRG